MHAGDATVEREAAEQIVRVVRQAVVVGEQRFGPVDDDDEPRQIIPGLLAILLVAPARRAGGLEQHQPPRDLGHRALERGHGELAVGGAGNESGVR